MSSFQCIQKYEGDMFQDSLHGEGRYIWKSSACEWSFDGTFYANGKQGFGRMCYSDGSRFEGLWLDDDRHGPGVMMQANGRQDVGLWAGQRLLRLAVALDGVPYLGTSTARAAKLLSFRHRLPLSEGVADVAEEVLGSTPGGAAVIGQSHLLYSRLARDSRSLFFNTRAHRSLSGPSPQDADSDGATHLVAWNNSAHVVHMMRHSYLHRHHQEVSEVVDAVVLARGRKERWAPAGGLESGSLELLSSCLEHRTTTLRWLLHVATTVHPCVADARGNCGLYFAAATDNHGAIDALLDRGACVDQVNDEGLTALAFCLLRLLAALRGVRDWGAAFLSPPAHPLATDDLPTAKQWPRLPPQKSEEESEEAEGADKLQEYVLGLGGSKKAELFSSNQKQDSRMESIQMTIAQLLRRGADPNAANVPCPSLQLAVHSGSAELVNLLLEHGADPNATSLLSEGGLTALHVVSMSSLGPNTVEMCRLLLLHGADPLVPIPGDIDQETVEELLYGRAVSEVPLGNRTALHALCMQPICNDDDSQQFIEELAELLGRREELSNGLMLGHSPLSLAVLWGNPGLVRGLLAAGHDPNLSLGTGLGSALAVLLACRSIDRHPAASLFLLCDLLMDHGADPLLMLDQADSSRGNILDFAYRELQARRDARPKDAAARKMAAEHLQTQEALVKRVADWGRALLVKNIQGRLIRQAIVTLRCDKHDSTIWTHLSGWLSHNEAARCLLLLSNAGELGISQHEASQVLYHTGSRKSEDVESSQSELHFLTPPEIDTCGKRYAVCFECLRSSMQLVECHACGLVSFCTADCSTASARRDTPHSCLPEFHLVKPHISAVNTPTCTHRKNKVIQEKNVPRRQPRKKKSSGNKVKMAEQVEEMAKAKEKDNGVKEILKEKSRQVTKGAPCKCMAGSARKMICHSDYTMKHLLDQFYHQTSTNGPSLVLLRNGDLYYWLYGPSPSIIENYSLN